MNKANYIRLTNGKTAAENYIDFKNEQHESINQNRMKKEEEAYIDKCFEKLGKTIEKSIEKSFKL